MKKLLLLTVFSIFGLTLAHSQNNWKIGVNAGIPVGEVEDFADLQLGADIAYRYNVTPMVDVGGLLGYSRYIIEVVESSFFGSESVEAPDIEFLPIAASGRLNFALLFLGADLGYAIGLNDGNDGGFYYRPLIGVKLGAFGVIGSYSGVSLDGDNIGSINLGVEFGF